MSKTTEVDGSVSVETSAGSGTSSAEIFSTKTSSTRTYTVDESAKLETNTINATTVKTCLAETSTSILTKIITASSPRNPLEK
jgi:hypothetical protein